MNACQRLAHDFPLKGVELRLEREQGRPSLWSWEVDSKVANFLHSFEVTGAHLPFIYLNPISPNTRIRDESIHQLKAAIKRASEINMDYVVMHARGSALGCTKEQTLRQWKEVIENLASYAQENSILLTIENADLLSNLRDLATIVKQINSKWLRITFDIGHAYMRSIPPLSSFPIRELALKLLDMTFIPFVFNNYMPYQDYYSAEHFLRSEADLIYNLHIHDCNGVRDHLGVGDGKINFRYLSKLNESKKALVLEAKLNDYYDDFKKNYERLKRLCAVEIGDNDSNSNR